MYRAARASWECRVTVTVPVTLVRRSMPLDDRTLALSDRTSEPRMSSCSTRVDGTAHVVKPFNGVKVFSATMLVQREQLGDHVTDWIRAHPQFNISDVVVTQSSDAAFHCIAISVFYNERVRR